MRTLCTFASTLAIILIVKSAIFAQVPKKPLYEEFTSSTCGPCYYLNQTLDPILAQNHQTHSVIKYQVDWPGSGDPYYLDQSEDRIDYYDVGGVPTVFINGSQASQVTDNFDQDRYDSYLGVMSNLSIDITQAEIDENNVVHISAKLTSFASFNLGLKAHVAIVEKRTVNNIRTNREEEFFHVVMQMLPNANGTDLPLLFNGQVEELDFSFDMTTTFMEERNDLEVIVFVQHDASKGIIQSEHADITGDFETYSVNIEVKNSDDEVVENARIFLENHGTKFTDENGISIYEDVLDGAFNYTVTYPRLLDAQGTIHVTDGDVDSEIIMEVPNFFYYEDFSLELPSDWKTFNSNSDAAYWWGGKVILFRQSGTDEKLMLVSPSFDLSNNNDGTIIFSLGGISGNPRAGFGTISDPSDLYSISELAFFNPKEEFEEYSYSIADMTGDLSNVNFYWDYKERFRGWYTIEYIIITYGNVSTADQALLKSISVFPNPANEVLTINSELDIKLVSIFNSNGRLMELSPNQNNHELDVSNYDAGLYHICIESNKGKVMKTVVIE